MVESEESKILTALLDSAAVGLIALDANGLVRTWNKGAERILGWHQSEVLGQPVPTLLLKKDGTAAPVELLTFENTFILTETSHQTEQRFQAIVEAAPDGIIKVDSAGLIVLVNRSAEILFGYDREELLGQPVEMLVPEDRRANHVHLRTRYENDPVKRPMGSGLDLYGRRKDGSLFPLEISLSPVQFEEGSRVISVIRDITERRQAEARIKALQEEHLREVERANQLKSEFLTNMSHELRSPLHTIVGFAELLSEETVGELNEKQKRFIGHIHKDSLHLLDLINDLLDLNKIEAGRLELKRQTFDIAATVEEVLLSMRARAAAKFIAIQTDAPVPLTLFADHLRVKQIMHNLISNAVKFTPENGKIWVAVTGRDGFAEISVTDTGIGIAADQQQAVFDKFYQVNAATKGGYEGTGLGLAITRRLVEQHGGRIWLKSEKGKGSCFTFTIPLDEVYEKSSDSGR